MYIYIYIFVCLCCVCLMCSSCLCGSVFVVCVVVIFVCICFCGAYTLGSFSFCVFVLFVGPTLWEATRQTTSSELGYKNTRLATLCVFVVCVCV